ncbi:MAG: DsbC family protein [Burkholderiales bacterium]
MAWVLAVAALAASMAAGADEASIRRMVESNLDGGKVERVQPSPVPGIFEVTVRSPSGPRVIYTDASGDHIFVGSLYDARSQRNLTEERMHKLSAIDFRQLPLDLAVKVRRGNGKRVLAVFSDPHCPYCRRFEQVLAKIDDITIYYFMYPVIHPELADQSRAVWCSPDRAKAWLALAARAQPQVPKGGTDCETPVDRVLDLGRSLHVNATPTLFLQTGARVSGGMDAADLVSLLDEAVPEPGNGTKPK